MRNVLKKGPHEKRAVEVGITNFLEETKAQVLGVTHFEQSLHLYI